MSLKLAFDRLATWTVAGVTNRGLDTFKVLPATADLPMLLPRLGGTGGESLRTLGISVDAGKVVVHVDHNLLVSGVGTAWKWYDTLALCDAYFAAVVDDLMLNGNLLQPLMIADTQEGVIDLGGNVLYYGVIFRHRWVLKVT